MRPIQSPTAPPPSGMAVKQEGKSQKTLAASPSAEYEADSLQLQRKGVAFNKPLIQDTLWYKIKRKALDIISNINIPAWRSHKLGDKAPAGLLAQLQPGDILLRRTDWTSGNLLIPSYWKHAAVYTGNGQLVEATFKGVKKNNLDDFAAHGDDMLILRPKNLTDDQRATMVAYSRLQEGRPYDFDMDFQDDRRLSCTELGAQALRASGLNNYVSEGFFGEIVGDYFKNDNFELVYTSNPTKSLLKKVART